jgi:copper chaperone
MEDSIRVAIDGMHCGACVRRVTTALEGLSGVRITSVEIGSANVSINPAYASEAAVIATLGRIGFIAQISR